MGVQAALSGISNLQLVSEIPVDMPDPLAGLYPNDPPTYSR